MRKSAAQNYLPALQTLMTITRMKEKEALGAGLINFPFAKSRFGSKGQAQREMGTQA